MTLTRQEKNKTLKKITKSDSLNKSRSDIWNRERSNPDTWSRERSNPDTWSRERPTGTPINKWTTVMPRGWKQGSYWEYNQKTGERRVGGERKTILTPRPRPMPTPRPRPMPVPAPRPTPIPAPRPTPVLTPTPINQSDWARKMSQRREEALRKRRSEGVLPQKNWYK